MQNPSASTIFLNTPAMRPALIVVDMQEDFCPPIGSLAVQDGRSIASTINLLLEKPGFVLRIFTQDYHPENHMSFASNHPPPDNQPFKSFVTIRNPASGKGSEERTQQLWPAHCVAETPGVEIIPEIDTSKADFIIRKGMRSDVEMYSVFADAFGNCDAGPNSPSVSLDTKEVLNDHGITDVFVVGLAGDYCVKATAIDAARAGFRSWVVEEGTKCVDPAAWDDTIDELKSSGVGVVSINDIVFK